MVGLYDETRNKYDEAGAALNRVEAKLEGIRETRGSTRAPQGRRIIAIVIR